MRDEFRAGAPLDIGGIADFLYVGTPPAGLELPRGTVAGGPEALAEYLRTFADAGVGQVQVRFPSRDRRRAVRPDRRLRRPGRPPGRPLTRWPDPLA